MHAALSVLFRWLHIVPAAILIGGVFTMQIVLPVGLRQLSEEQRQAVFLKCRRIFKMTVHSCILLLLISGAVNSYFNWDAYKARVPLSHAFWGPHVILALTAMAILLYVLTGKEPPAAHKRWTLITLVVLLIVVLCADLTKWARERPLPLKQASVDTRG